jgi:hypothetical protein
VNVKDTKVKVLARQYAQGKATAQDVVSAVVLRGHREAKTLDEKIKRYQEQDDGYSSEPNDWTDIQVLHILGELTDAQYNELYQAAFPGVT